MLVTSTELFKHAKENHYAIPSANFFDLDSLRWHVETAEELGLPIIVAFCEGHLSPNLILEESAYMGRKIAEEAKVPVVLHLDHGTTPSFIKKAVDLGFTSVMIDASMESFDDNVRITNDIIEYAHKRGVVVEAEIGHVGIGQNIGISEGGSEDSQYTTVASAVEFAEKTNVDSLAISIGTAHGLYKGIPKINFDRLKEIYNAIETPLVLHGGSSSGDENLNKCATNGICKINIYTDFLVAAKKEIDENMPANYLQQRMLAREGVKKCLKHYYNVFATKKFE